MVQIINETILEKGLVHEEKLDKKKVRLISFVSFLMGFSQATFAYVMSSYFKQASGTENVGAFYFLAYAIVLIALLNLHKIIRKIGKSRVFLFSILIKIGLIFALSIMAPSLSSTIFLMGYIILGALSWVDLDIMLESFSQDNMSGRIRGAYLTIMNVGYLLGPFLATKILAKYDFAGIFILLLIFNCLIFSIAAIGLRNVNHKFDKKVSILELLKKVRKMSDVIRIYYISLVLEFFYSLMVIFTPIYLLDQGLSWNEIGIIFTAMLVPFVLLQYPVGRLADKRLGEKELLLLAILVMGFSTGAVYFIQGKTIAVWATILFVTRVGAALIEILRDSYFYKKIDGHDVDIIDFFRSALPVGSMVATFISIIVLMFFPLKTIFLIIGVVVLSALIPVWNLVDSKSEKESAN